MNVLLQIVQGPAMGARVSVTPGATVLVGRGAGCALEVGDDGSASRVHCLVEYTPSGLFLLDYSRYGTRVNGQSVRRAELGHGDRVTLGDATEIAVQAPHLSPIPGPAPGPGPAGWPVPGFSPLEPLQPEREDTGIAVWRARREADGERVVVKFRRRRALADAVQEQRMQDLFVRELEISSSLRHPRLLRFLGGELLPEVLFLAMEDAPGRDGDAYFRAHGLLTDAEAARIGRQALEGLVYAHARQVIHRDVKPANLFVERTPGGLECRLGDFGLARHFGQAARWRLTRANEFRGTLDWMAPEQIWDCQNADHRVDLFAVGATLYTFLTGVSPYTKDSPDARGWQEVTAEDVLAARVTPLEKRRPETAPGLIGVIDRGLRISPARRFQSASEMEQALVRVMESERWASRGR